jgi:hypothetical protein
MIPWWLLPIGVGAGLAYLIVRERNGKEDAEYLARMTILEAGGIGPSEEWAGIMWVAMNRAKTQGRSVKSIVTDCRFPGCSSRGYSYVEAVAAPGGVGYESPHGHHSPLDHREWPQALDFATKLVQGKIENPVGPREHFFHPGGMPRCSAEGAWNERRNRICHQGHWWPLWGFAEYAENPPIRLGRAVFS